MRNLSLSLIFLFGALLLHFSCTKQDALSSDLLQQSDGAAEDRRPNQTAQSIGATFNGAPSTDIVLDLVNSVTWTYNHACVDGYFTYTFTGCPPSNTEHTMRVQVRNENKCAFWNGGVLVGATRRGCRKCTSGPDQCTPWTATLMPNAALSGRSCWDDEVLTEGTLTTDLSAQVDIAGESVLDKSGTFNGNCNRWTRKFSFSLLDAEYTRVLGVVVSLQKSDDAGLTWYNVADSGVPADVTNIEAAAYGYFYEANGGTFGNLSAQALLISGQTQGEIMDNTGTPQSGDNFCGNNSNFGDGSYAAVAHGPTLGATVGEGQYRYNVTGTIKGNSGGANQGFNINTKVTTITIDAPNCN